MISGLATSYGNFNGQFLQYPPLPVVSSLCTSPQQFSHQYFPFPCPTILYFNHLQNTQYWIKTLHLLSISPTTSEFCCRNSYHSVLTPPQIHFPAERAPGLPGNPICAASTHSPILQLFQTSLNICKPSAPLISSYDEHLSVQFLGSILMTDNGAENKTHRDEVA